MVASLVKMNGLSAGPVPISGDTTVMKTLKLASTKKGFEQVFTGRDCTGIRFLPGPDCRFERPPHLDPGDEFFDGNSGYLEFITDHRVWPTGIKIQGNNMNRQHAFGMDAKVVETDVPDARTRVYRPVGEWSSVGIVYA